MTGIGLRCRAVIVGVAVALLAGCGGAQPPVAAPQTSAVATSAAHRALTTNKKTFSYIGRFQTFVVPAGVTEMKVNARGAQGGGSNGGLGGHVIVMIAVTPGQKLRVLVGGQPSTMTGGFNGGGTGGLPSGCNYFCGYGGGGASDVRAGDKSIDRVVVAGGGGGQGADGYPGQAGGTGGDGGGEKGATGGAGFYYGGYGGHGGTQHHGGAGGAEGYGSIGNGAGGVSGTLGDGGDGGQGCATTTRTFCGSPGANGGGGGGGYYGGGGGGAGPGTTNNITGGGGGGGGSSHIERGEKTLVDSRGWKHATGNGLVVLSWQ